MKKVLLEIISFATLIVACLCLLAFFATLVRALTLMRTNPAYALGEVTAPVIIGAPCLVFYRWSQRRIATLKGDPDVTIEG